MNRPAVYNAERYRAADPPIEGQRATVVEESKEKARYPVPDTRPRQPESPSQTLNDARVLVIGLGRFGGGIGVTRWLASQGAAVTVTDQADPDELEKSIQDVEDLDIQLQLGGHDPRILDKSDLVIVNPAVRKRESALFQEILRRGIPWTTEINLFCERCPAPVIGITGSYGKSTTCTMLAVSLEAHLRSGHARYTGVHLGGNIGKSLLSDLPRIRKTDWVVLELSNAQLEDLPRIRWAPNLAVLLNLAPHHLDRYDGLAEYAAAKLNVARDPDGESRVIVGQLHPAAEALLAGLLKDRPDRLTRIHAPEPPIDLVVPGDHNQMNAAAVLEVGRHLGIDEGRMRIYLRSFAGLPHRLELIRSINDVDYYNDSKSTSPAATLTALNCFDRPVITIVGGQDKGTPPKGWAADVAESAKAVICTGESGPGFAENLRETANSQGAVAVTEAADLAEAVQAAKALGRPGDAVLFSPGAPSFDRYANFVERGEHFRSIVERL